MVKSLIESIKRPEIIVFLVLLLISVIAFVRRVKAVRQGTLLVGMIYLGFIQGFYLPFVVLTAIILGKFLPIANYVYWYLLVGPIIIITFIFGRIYCGWLCPFGAAQEFLYKVGIKKARLPRKMDSRVKILKYLLLIIVLMGVIVTKKPGFGNYEPFVVLFKQRGNFIQWAFLAVILVASIFVSRPFCRYLCLAGAIQALLSRLSLFKLKIKEGCKQCQACEKICPVDAISIHSVNGVQVNRFECIRCNQCMLICPLRKKDEGGKGNE